MKNFTILTTRPLIPNKISFKSGDISLYTDFDGTYFPLGQQDLNTSENDPKIQNLKKYFETFNKFLKNSGEKFKLVLTTGRNLGELKQVLTDITKKNVPIAYPTSVIIKNGADEYLKTDSTFPYTPLNVNESKRAAIKNITNGWDGNEISNKLNDILKHYDFQVLSSPTTRSINDYGDKTSQYILSKISKDNEPSPWVSTIRQDGNLSFTVAFPKDMNQNPQRQKIKNLIIGKIKEYFELKEIKYSLIDNPSDNECDYAPSITICPKIGNKKLTKLYDVKNAVEKANLNNDLVVVAGDYGNDTEMLNPVNYIEKPNDLNFPEYIELEENSLDNVQKNPHKYYVNNQMKGQDKRAEYKAYLEDLKNYINTHHEYKEELQKLPLMSVVVGKDHEVLNKLVEVFKETGLNKVNQVNSFELLEGTIDSVKKYQNINDVFKLNSAWALKNAPNLENITYETNRIIIQDVLSNPINPLNIINKANPSQKTVKCTISKNILPDSRNEVVIADTDGTSSIKIKYGQNAKIPDMDLVLGAFSPKLLIKDVETGSEILIGGNSSIKGENFSIKSTQNISNKISFTGNKSGKLFITEAFMPDNTEKATKEYFTKNLYKNSEKGDLYGNLKYDYSVIGLAAGFGSRLASVSGLYGDNKPSTLLPGEDFRLLQLSVLNSAVKAGIINPEDIKESINNNKITSYNTLTGETKGDNDSKVFFLKDPDATPLGTGGSFLSALKNGIVPDNKPAVIMIGDYFTNIDISRALKEFEDTNAGFMLIAHPIDESKLSKLPIIDVSSKDNHYFINNFCHLPNNNEAFNYLKGKKITEGKYKESYATSSSMYIIHPAVLKRLKTMVEAGKEYSFGKFLPEIQNMLNKNGEIQDEYGNTLKMMLCFAEAKDGKVAACDDIGTFEGYLDEIRSAAQNIDGKYNGLPDKLEKDFENLVDKETDVVYMSNRAKTNFELFKKKYSIQKVQGDIIVK